MENAIRQLKNGAAVLAEFKGNDTHMVLCKWRDDLVTWRVDDDDNAYLGHYYNEAQMHDAMADFVKRSIGPRPERIVCDNSLPSLLQRQAD